MTQSSKLSFNAYTLKIVALVFMVLDHIHSYLNIGPAWISILTRFVAPLFVYFLVEGFHYTRNRKKYALRLGLFALIVSGGNIILNTLFHKIDYSNLSYFELLQGNNIFLTLFVFMIILIVLDKKCQSVLSRIVKVMILIVLSFFAAFFCEGGLYLVPLLYVFYYTYGNKTKTCSGILIWSLLLLAKALYSYFSGGTGISLYQTLTFSSEWGMMLSILPIALYSGKRGKQTSFSKWMFYIVYPLHLWILVILSNVIVR